ncbi:MAG TPA: hypothetical protein VEX38_02225 [Fimbriimonadaceae bacterium]|nr:hypothetical protein [Fimbriimonadaceae bacterium]
MIWPNIRVLLVFEMKSSTFDLEVHEHLGRSDALGQKTILSSLVGFDPVNLFTVMEGPAPALAECASLDPQPHKHTITRRRKQEECGEKGSAFRSKYPQMALGAASELVEIPQHRREIAV